MKFTFTGRGKLLLPSDVRDCRLSWVDANKVSIETGVLTATQILSGQLFSVVVTAPLTADISVLGVNGLDVGAEVPSTWYAVYVIGDSTGVNPNASLLSTDFGIPTLPAGYDIFRRVGCVRNDAAGDFIKFFQVWNNTVRRYWYDVDMAGAATQVLFFGSATVYTAVPLSSFVPPVSTNVILALQLIVAAGNGDSARLRPTGSTVDNFRSLSSILPVAVVDRSFGSEIEMPCSNTQSIDYILAFASDDLNIHVEGFDDEI